MRRFPVPSSRHMLSTSGRVTVPPFFSIERLISWRLISSGSSVSSMISETASLSIFIPIFPASSNVHIILSRGQRGNGAAFNTVHFLNVSGGNIFTGSDSYIRSMTTDESASTIASRFSGKGPKREADSTTMSLFSSKRPPKGYRTEGLTCRPPVFRISHGLFSKSATVSSRAVSEPCLRLRSEGEGIALHHYIYQLAGIDDLDDLFALDPFFVSGLERISSLSSSFDRPAFTSNCSLTLPFIWSTIVTVSSTRDSVDFKPFFDREERIVPYHMP